MPRLSVIIPTLNEGAYLPGLLDALNEQTCPPDEVIVADAGSRDGTVAFAQARGAQVVRGGMPAVGRNAGAKVATGELFQFFDADVLPNSDYCRHAVDEFTSSGYAVATCLLGALSADPGDRVLTDATNLMLQIARPITPRAPGFCILARREVHEAIGGFDESLKMSEDHDYVRRATQLGEFGILRHTVDGFSLRLRNPVMPVRAQRLVELRVDGTRIDPAQVQIMRKGYARQTSSITPVAPFDISSGDHVTVVVPGHSLTPGIHELDVEVEFLGLGKIAARWRDRLV